MKSRNIKPAFFKNEELAEMPSEARLLFIGLWMLADRNGRLEYRPKRIKAELFPYGMSGKIEKLLETLCNSSEGLVTHYGDEDGQYLVIHNFVRHQSPHKNEKDNNIPCLDDCQVITGNSMKLRPPLMNVERGMMKEERVSSASTTTYSFEEFWNAYDYKKGKTPAEGVWNKIKMNDTLYANILNGARCEAKLRPALLANNSTPKMAQGWLTEKRWEDYEEAIESVSDDSLRQIAQQCIDSGMPPTHNSHPRIKELYQEMLNA
jgi:hypothetical protein